MVLVIGAGRGKIVIDWTGQGEHGFDALYGSAVDFHLEVGVLQLVSGGQSI
jgi:hypothetical protein